MKLIVSVKILLQEWRLVLVRREVVCTTWIWIAKIWIDKHNNIRRTNLIMAQKIGTSLISYLRKLFPSSFSKVQVSIFHYNSCVSIFHYNSCVLAKHHQTFPSSFNKTLVSFSIIHSDVLGSLHVINYLDS